MISQISQVANAFFIDGRTLYRDKESSTVVLYSFFEEPLYLLAISVGVETLESFSSLYCEQKHFLLREVLAAFRYMIQDKKTALFRSNVTNKMIEKLEKITREFDDKKETGELLHIMFSSEKTIARILKPQKDEEGNISYSLYKKN